MSRAPRSERMANKGRPKRRASAKTHFFKYQLTGDPSRAEENDLKRALQESLMEQFSKNNKSGSSNSNAKKSSTNNHNINNNIIFISSTNSSDVSGSTRSNSTSRSNDTSRSSVSSVTKKRTRSSNTLNNNVNNSTHSSNTTTTTNKRAKTNYSNNNNTVELQNKSAPTILATANSPPLISTQLNNNKAIKTYSRSQLNGNNNSLKQQQQQQLKSQTIPGPKSSTPIKNSTTRSNDKSPTIPKTTSIATTITTPTSNKSSKAQLACASKSTQTPSVSGILKKTPSSTKSDDSMTVQQNKSIDNHINDDNNASNLTTCEQPEQNQYLKFKRESKNYAYVKMTALKVSSSKSPSNSTKRVPQGSWSLLGVPEEKVIYLRQDEPPRRLICYPAIKHVEGDVIQVRDSVLLRSGARKTDLPFIAKVCAFWEDAETGNVMMSLFWYYRPEHTEAGRKPQHLADEIFASRHRDVDSVECIEDKCYVLTFNEYCRYRKRCKMEQVNTTWSLTDVTIPLSNELYPRKNRIPDSDVNPELVFCCRRIYDIYKHSVL